MIVKSSKTPSDGPIQMAAAPAPRRVSDSQHAGQACANAAPAGVVLARLVGFADSHPMILVHGSDRPLMAASACQLLASDLDRVVAVSFLDNDASKPIVMGPIVGMPIEPEASPPARLELIGSSEVVLRCGAATLRLLADGTAILRGVNVITRAAATNRIRGGNVQIN